MDGVTAEISGATETVAEDSATAEQFGLAANRGLIGWRMGFSHFTSPTDAKAKSTVGLTMSAYHRGCVRLTHI